MLPSDRTIWSVKSGHLKSVICGHETSALTKFGRMGFRRNFRFNSAWRGRHYANKQLEAFAVREGDDWLVITVVTRYY